MQRDEISAWMTLIRAAGIGSAAIHILVQRFGTAAATISAPHHELSAAGLDDSIVGALKNPDSKSLDKDLAWLGDSGVQLITRGSELFPELLEQTSSPPAALFVLGDPEVLSIPQLAIVGSRNPTETGREIAAEFSAHLASRGLAITSGLALGIDTAAHRGALAASGLTIAVCGTGLDTVYPRDNRELATEIAKEGALVSEFPPATRPRRENFPMRNRIISGLSLGTLVVEAAQRSGSLITARKAAEQGREVFAVPGSIHNPLSKGCHRLIRDGAKLVESADHIFEELGSLFGSVRAEIRPQAEGRKTTDTDMLNDPDYVKVLDAIGFDPTRADRIVERTGLTADVVSSMLLILELHGHVVSAPGGGYTRRTRSN